MLKEFRTFIARGNVLDLAVGVVVGGAFSKIVTSLVDDVIMPLVGLLLGGLDFSSLSIQVGKAKMYGSFIQNVVDFLIVAFCIFLMVKTVNKLTKKLEAKKEKEKKAEEAKKAENIILLEEIRDLLKEKNKNIWLFKYFFICLEIMIKQTFLSLLIKIKQLQFFALLDSYIHLLVNYNIF